MKKLAFAITVFFVPFLLIAQDLPIDSQFVNGYWQARWISLPDAEPNSYGVYHFRKSFDLAEVPGQFFIHVSADNRYKLFVNGKEMSSGPARGDIEHWRFETVDIASALKAGTNTLAAVVWNFGSHAPVAQVWNKTGFILQGNSNLESVVNTDTSWKVIQNKAYSPETESREALRSYIVVGPGDIVEGRLYPWSWEKPDFDDSKWVLAATIAEGKAIQRGTDGDWLFVPRKIPPMASYKLRQMKPRRSDGVAIDDRFTQGNSPVVIPANTEASILFDQIELTNGYPFLTVTGGLGSEVKISYSESLFYPDNSKGNRNEIEGKQMKGMVDIFRTDGGDNRVWSPLWFRTWRYIQLDIKTADKSLTLNNLETFYYGYPFEEKATFASDQDWTQDVWDVGWQTAELCAGENYFDCPYYEQLQYVGDTRIQALISLYVAGDDRLVRKAINDFEQSRVWNGLTESRYPSSRLQIIPPYSLFWIAMVHDYWMLRPDTEFVEGKLAVVRSILEWYDLQVNDQGMLGKMPWWNFVDWTEEWAWNSVTRAGGVPAEQADGNSSVLTSQYIYALQYAEELHRSFGHIHQADVYQKQRQNLLSGFNELCWDSKNKLYADIPGAEIYSQHANIFAILTDALPAAEQKELMIRIMEDDRLIQATFYFKFYLFRALVKTGLADYYLEQLKPWREMLDLGLTTFAEKPDPTRSDCHAWSASPNYDFLATVAGIMPASSGFSSVRIAPALGSLNKVFAAMPHPNGELKVNFSRNKEVLSALIVLPPDLEGELFWHGKTYPLKSGENKIKAK